MFRVYQVSLSHFAENGNFKSDDLMRKHFDITFHGKVTADDFMMYRPVCDIDATDLNQVFEIGNIGPEEKITRIDSMHSISVGDVILNLETGEYSIVAKFGFEPLPTHGNLEVA